MAGAASAERAAADREKALATALSQGRYGAEGWRVRKDGGISGPL